MSLIQDFKTWFETSASGQDQSFISRAPNSNIVDDSIWWFRAAGGGQTGKTLDGRLTVQKVIEAYYRDVSSLTVADKMETLEDEIRGCMQIGNYEVVEVETTGPFSDQDLDNEERTVGLLQITLTIYKV